METVTKHSEITTAIAIPLAFQAGASIKAKNMLIKPAPIIILFKLESKLFGSIHCFPNTLEIAIRGISIDNIFRTGTALSYLGPNNTPTINGEKKNVNPPITNPTMVNTIKLN